MLLFPFAAWALAPTDVRFSPLTLGDDVWTPDHVSLEALGIPASFTDGWAFDIRWDQEHVGYVIVADGSLEVQPPTEADRIRLGNQRVVLAGEPVEAVRPMRDGEAWRLDSDLALVLTRDTPAGMRDAHQVRGTTADGQELVVVTDLRGLAAARDRADAALRSRQNEWFDQGHDPRALLAADGAVPGTGRGASVWLHLVQPLGGLLGRDTWDGSDDPAWVHTWKDPTGAWKERGGVEVRAAADHRAFRRKLWSDATPAPAAWQVEARFTEVTATPREREVDLDIESLVVARAERDGVDRLVLDLPRAIQVPWGAGSGAPPSRFEVEGITDEHGAALPWRFIDPASASLDVWIARVEVTIPTASAGAPVAVRVRVRDNATVEHRATTERPVPSFDTFTWNAEVYDLGSATLPLRVTPQVVHANDDLPPAVVESRVPVRSRLSIVASGVGVDSETEDGWLTRRTVEANREPVTTFGRWHVRQESAAAGMPAVRVSTFQGWPKPQAALAVHTRQVLNFYTPLLPDYPGPAVDIVQHATLVSTLIWYLPHASVVPLPAGAGSGPLIHEIYLRKDLPELEWMVLSTNLAAQYWMDDLAGSDESFGIALAASRTYGTLLVDAAFANVGDQWRDWFRKGAIDQDHRRAWPIHEIVDGPEPLVHTWDAATMTIGHTLREAVGDRAWLEAMDGLVSGRFGDRLDCGALTVALSTTSGRDLGPLVDYWLGTGIPPRVTVEWSHSEAGTRVEATSDVPFGTFELPVALYDGAMEVARLRVRVVDGHGVATHPGAASRIVVDPEERLLLQHVDVGPADRLARGG